MSAAAEFLKNDVKRSVLFLLVSAAALVLSYLRVLDLPFDIAWVAIILCGAPIIWDAVTGLVLRHDIKADVLVASAIVSAVILQEWFAAGEVALIMELGGLLEEVSAAKANKGIEALLRLAPRTGRVVRDGTESEVPVEGISVGDILRVRPGETVPVDGIIVSGTTSVDQSVLTGESVPVDKGPGDGVFSGTMNQMGAFDMRATRRSDESSMQRLAGLAASVDADRARVVRTADRWATYMVLSAMAITLVTYLLTLDVYRALTVMVVFCPCAFVLATPTALVAAMGNLAKHGILVRDGDAMERAAMVDAVAFDKTGTITFGAPDVVADSAVDDIDAFRSLVASAESLSEHPLGRAIAGHYRSMGIRIRDPQSFSASAGMGVSASVDGVRVVVGSPAMIRDAGAVVPEPVLIDAAESHSKGYATVFVAFDGAFAGTVSLSDTVRDESRATVSQLDAMGVRTVLLTGDNSRAAGHMASRVGITEVVSDCTPEGKVDSIGSMQAAGSRVCMIGDGVNDAPALRKAWVGVAMGGAGTDIAVESADMVLVGDRLGEVPHMLALCRRMRSTIRLNIGFSLLWNFIAVGLAMAAVLGPVEGAVVHNVGSVAVVLNSLILLFAGRKSDTPR